MPSAWIAYLAAALLGEVLLPFAPAATALIDSTVVVVALTHFGYAQRSPIALGDPTIRLLPALALLPLLRLLSLTLPVPDLSPIVWLGVTAGPLLLAVVASARLAHLDVHEMAIGRPSYDLLSLLVVGASLPAGLALGWLSSVPLVADANSPIATGATAAVLVVGAAIPEELVFRGLLQPLLVDLVGRAAPVVAAVAFASTYVGGQSAVVVVLMGAVGLVYGLEVRRSGSLWPALVGHAVLVLTAVFLAPTFLG